MTAAERRLRDALDRERMTSASLRGELHAVDVVLSTVRHQYEGATRAEMIRELISESRLERERAGRSVYDSPSQSWE